MRASSAAASGESDGVQERGSVGKLVLNGDTPMPNCVVNLMKNIVGSGVLTLAGGVAAMSDQRMVLVFALSLALGFAMVAGYCFNLIAQVADLTGSKSYT